MKPVSATFFVQNYNRQLYLFLHDAATRLNTEIYFQRDSKHRLGTFMVKGADVPARVYVRRNLPLGHFLIILCHELGHAMVWREYGNRAQAHGEEWKFAFKMLLRIAMSLYEFDEEWKTEALYQLEKPRVTYENPEADAEMKDGEIQVRDLPDGAEFVWKEKAYRKISLQRTRVLCQRLDDRRKYLFVGKAVVKHNLPESDEGEPGRVG